MDPYPTFSNAPLSSWLWIMNLTFAWTPPRSICTFLTQTLTKTSLVGLGCCLGAAWFIVPETQNLPSPDTFLLHSVGPTMLLPPWH